MTVATASRALKKHLDALYASSLVPVVWPNSDLPAPTNCDHIHVDIVWSDNQRLSIRGNHRLAGSLVVTIGSPTGRGSGESEKIADEVAAHFATDTVIAADDCKVRISARPSVRGGFIDERAWRTPVVIPFEILT